MSRPPSRKRTREVPVSLHVADDRREFNLTATQLTNLPDYVCRFVNLQRLHLSGNKLRKLPESVMWLRDDMAFDVTENPELPVDHPRPRSLHRTLGPLIQLLTVPAYFQCYEARVPVLRSTPLERFLGSESLFDVHGLQAIRDFLCME